MLLDYVVIRSRPSPICLRSTIACSLALRITCFKYTLVLSGNLWYARIPSSGSPSVGTYISNFWSVCGSSCIKPPFSNWLNSALALSKTYRVVDLIVFHIVGILKSSILSLGSKWCPCFAQKNLELPTKLLIPKSYYTLFSNWIHRYSTSSSSSSSYQYL